MGTHPIRKDSAMKTALLACSLLGLTALALLPVSAQKGATATPESDADAGAVTTLYVHDPLLCSLDLRRGAAGLIVQQGEVRNKDSHLCLGYYPDCLTVGIQGGETGAIVDLGTFAEIGTSSGMRLTGNGGNVFVAIGADLVRARTAQLELASLAHAPIHAGHVYLARIGTERTSELLAKILVLEFRPGESVTFRWQLVGG